MTDSVERDWKRRGRDDLLQHSSLSSAPLSQPAPDPHVASETNDYGTVYMYVHVCVCLCVSTCSYSSMIQPAQIPACQLNCLTAFSVILSSVSCRLSL